MQPSPAPRRVVRPWVWVALIVMALVGACGAAAWRGPGWAARKVERRLVEAIETRLDANAQLGSVELRWGAVDVRDVAIMGRGENGEARAQFERVRIFLDRDELWRGRVRVRAALVEGGRIAGQYDTLMRWADRARHRPDTASTDEGRIRTRPKLAQVRGLALDVSAGTRHLAGIVDADVDLSRRGLSLRLEDCQATQDGFRLRAERLAVETSWVRGEDGSVDVAWPLVVQVESAEAPITERIAVGGVDGWASVSDKSASDVALALTGSFVGGEGHGDVGELWSVEGHVLRDLSAGAMRLNMDAFELGRVPSVVEQLPLVESEAATVGGALAVEIVGGLVRLEGDLDLSGLNVQHRLLSRDVVSDVGFQLGFAAEIDPMRRHATIHYADLRRRGVELRALGEVDWPSERAERSVVVSASVPAVPCQTVLEAIPGGLVPSLRGFAVEGEFDLDMSLKADFGDLEALDLSGDVGIWNCRVRRAPSHSVADQLRGAFTHVVRLRDGGVRRLPMGLSAPTFASYRMISPFMVQAVLTTEDGGFFRHRGFLPSQIEVALRRNLEAGEIRLGASTITMQMVKNVLLSHERTLSRKLQELFLTWYVEQILSKERIMEVYLNAIEFGPGIYGLTHAAARYFGKHPVELNPIEAVYLALMLPSPVRRSVHFCKGALSPSFDAKLRRLLKIMNDRGRLSDLEYELWKDVPLEFDLSRRGSEAVCFAQMQQYLEGSHTQRAISGLLGDGSVDEDNTGDRWEAELPARVHEDAPRNPAEMDAPGRPAMDEDVGLRPRAREP